jgi:hypothetical protein
MAHFYGGENVYRREEEVAKRGVPINYQQGEQICQPFCISYCIVVRERRSKYRLFKSLSNKKCVQTKTVCFWFCSFFFRQLFVFQTHVYFQNHVVVSLFRLLTNTNRSK